MKHRLASLLAAAALAFAGVPAHAQQYALTSKNVHLRAGPGQDYPVVAVLPPQVQVLVYGCIPSYTWCDVLAGDERGWVYAGNLLYDYGNRIVVLPSVAPIVGIGIATFIIDDYWHDHYANRWWWPQRRRWYHPEPGREYGRDYREQGRDGGDRGRDYRDPGRDYRNQGRDYRDQGRDYRDQGRDYRDQGRDYRDQGRDSRDPGRDYRDPGREHREPPRSGQGPGQYPAPRAGAAPAAPQVQRDPKETMRRALEQPQRPQQQRQPQPLPQTQ